MQKKGQQSGATRAEVAAKINLAVGQAQLAAGQIRGILPDNFKDAYTDPGRLKSLLMFALRAEFFDEALEPARQLLRISSEEQRPEAAAILGETLLGLRRFSEAERFLEDAMRRYGRHSFLLTSAGLASEARGDTDRAERSYWQALQIDPNNERALVAYLSARSRDGRQDGRVQAYRQIAELSGAWRFLLWMARDEIESDNVPAALDFYREVLHRESPAPPDAIAQSSGDLGRAGHFREAIDMCSHIYDARAHGVPAGINLIRCYLALNDPAPGRRIVEELFALYGRTHRSLLTQYDADIGAKESELEMSESPPRGIRLVTSDSLIWAQKGTPAWSLLPAKGRDAPTVAFIQGTLERTDPDSGGLMAGPAQVWGRLTRAIPMLMAEHFYLCTNARTSFSYVRSDGGFMIDVKPWSVELLGRLGVTPDYLVQLHLIGDSRSLTAACTLVKPQTGTKLGEWQERIEMQTPSKQLIRLMTRLREELESLGEVTFSEVDRKLEPPAGVAYDHYVNALEQGLAVANQPSGGRRTLRAERNIIDQLFRLATLDPLNLRARLLLMSTLGLEAEARPDIGREFLQDVEELEREWPLPPDQQPLVDYFTAKIRQATTECVLAIQEG
jgi:tetratricopeptide (TPR) repeat protein